MVKTLRLPGLLELPDIGIPTQLVLCEKDRVFPHPRGARHFVKHLPAGTKITRLDGVGHIPMLEAPGRVTELIADFVDAHTAPAREEVPPTG
jgi:pimeloyl-ACP methyl ester carboxylesterase